MKKLMLLALSLLFVGCAGATPEARSEHYLSKYRKIVKQMEYAYSVGDYNKVLALGSDAHFAYFNGNLTCYDKYEVNTLRHKQCLKYWDNEYSKSYEIGAKVERYNSTQLKNSNGRL